ncbi:unnamed protein product [Victoria cruziana]
MAMNDRIQPGTYFQYSPSGIQSSPYNTMRPSTASMDRDGNRYLAELLAERQKLGPFMQVLPLCSRLLNQEIVRASGLASNQGFGDERFEHGSPLRSGGLLSNGAPMDLEGWSGMQTEKHPQHRMYFVWLGQSGGRTYQSRVVAIQQLKEVWDLGLMIN